MAALFLGEGAEGAAASVTASDPRVTYLSKTAATQPGTYAIEVTGLAERASVVGGQAVYNLLLDEALTITYGGSQVTVDLLAGDSLSAVVSKINSALSANGLAATADDDGTGRIMVTTNGYGSSETISVVSDLDSAPGTTGFGTAPVTATGTDVAGTINGNLAIGNGHTLTGANGNSEEGLSLDIAQSSTGSYGTVTVTPDSAPSEGSSILVNLRTMLDSITDPLSGPIHTATDGLNNTIRGLQDRISDYEDRLEVRREQLTAEYSRADQALRMLTVLQNQLNGQLGTLSQLTQQ